MAFQVDPQTPRPGWTIEDWRGAVASGQLHEERYVAFFERLGGRDPAWIFRAPAAAIVEQLRALRARPGAAELPLCGVPIAVKDNIDVAGWRTTAACPQFAYMAEHDAHVVHQLREAGAIFVGKTNLDQFASGLVGTRSPYGIVTNAFDGDYISGGSSSGSASVVAKGWVPVALGTDTAGSGRVPAAFNNIVGLKPSKGLLSTRGLVPACRTLDCVSIFALTVDDAEKTFQILAHFDPLDPYARCVALAEAEPLVPSNIRLGVPDPLLFFEDSLARRAFEETRDLIQAQGVSIVPVDFAPFSALAALLYQSSWVAERALVAKSILHGPAEWMDPSVRTILQAAAGRSAEQAFEDEYRRAELARQINEVLGSLNALLVPTTPTIYRVSDVAADPLGTNSRLGTYTNFTNLADLSGLAIPGHMRADGLPAGITLLGRAFADRRLAQLGRWIEGLDAGTLGATERRQVDVPRAARPSVAGVALDADSWVDVAVVGAHLSGMALNHQLTSRGGRLVLVSKTSAHYRMYLLPGTVPAKPGLERVDDGAQIALEVWRLSLEQFGAFVREVPPPLGIGSVELEDGRWVKGFICEHAALLGAQDITSYGGFRAYLAARSP